MNNRYQWNARRYNANSASQQRWARELIEKLLLNGNEHLLDIGCGDGKITAELSARLKNGSATGVDSSPEMIAFARDHFPPDRFPRLHFEVRDASALDYAAVFDVVFSNAALHWIIGHERLLAGIRQALRPGGRLLVQMGGAGNAAPLIEIFENVMAEKPWSGYFRDFSFPYGFYTAEQYRGWLNAAGLEPLRVEIVAKDMVQQGEEGLCDWILVTWLPYMERIPQERRRKFVSEVASRYLAVYPPDNDGCVRIPMRRLEVEAKKR